MFRKFSRLVLVASVAAGFSLAPMLTGPAYADSGVDVYNVPRGFDSGNPAHETKIYMGDSVTWYIKEGTHNITPAEDRAGGQKWGQKASADLAAGDTFVVKFDKAGMYYYFSSVGGEGKDDKGNLSGMWAKINVIDPAATSTTTQPPTTTTQPPTGTTQPAAQPTTTTTAASAPAGPAGIHPPGSAAPAPTTTTATAKAEKNKNPKDSSTTTATPPPAPVNLPDSAIIPLLPSAGTSSTVQDGTVAAPGSAPEGDAVAVLKQKHSHKGMLVLVATGFGIGALGIGAAGYKFAHRSSKYFPA